MLARITAESPECGAGAHSLLDDSDAEVFTRILSNRRTSRRPMMLLPTITENSGGAIGLSSVDQEDEEDSLFDVDSGSPSESLQSKLPRIDEEDEDDVSDDSSGKKVQSAMERLDGIVRGWDSGVSSPSPLGIVPESSTREMLREIELALDGDRF